MSSFSPSSLSEASPKSLTFFDLPYDLCLDILQTWIAHLPSFAMVDIAFSHTYRTYLLLLFSDAYFFLPINPPIILRSVTNEKAFLRWLSDRQIKIRYLSIACRTLESLSDPIVLRGLTEMKLYRNISMATTAFALLPSFLIYSTPSLTALHLYGTGLSDLDLLPLLKVSGKRLKCLKISSPEPSQAMISRIAYHFCKVLQELCLTHVELEDGHFHCLAGCINLRSLQLSVRRLTFPSFLHLASHCRQLSTIVLRDCSFEGDTNLIKCVHYLKHLKHFVALGWSKTAATSLLFLLYHCPHLLSVLTSDYEFFAETGNTLEPFIGPDGCLIERDDDSADDCLYDKGCSIQWKTSISPSDLLSVLRKASSVSSLSCYYPFSFTRSTWSLIASIHGQSLTEFIYTYPSQIREDNLHCLLAKSNNLRVLCLSACKHGLQDSTLRALADGSSCLSLCFLRLEQAVLITDEAIICLLQRCAHLQMLHLPHAIRLSDRSLHAVPRCCPCIKEMNWTGTAVTANGIGKLLSVVTIARSNRRFTLLVNKSLKNELHPILVQMQECEGMNWLPFITFGMPGEA